jgi:hypothetical protein
MNDMVKQTGRGLLAGALATAGMSAFMLGAKRVHALGSAPPRELTDRFLRMLDVRPWASRSMPATVANHFLFGAVAAVPFALIVQRRRARRVLPPRGRAVVGAGYGVAVWAAMYGALLPAAGMMPRPRHDRPGRPMTMALAHVVYGALVGLFV